MLESLGLEVWHAWLLIACVIAAVELLLVGSYYLLAVAAGAMVVGSIHSMMALSVAAQWFVFTLATAVAALLMGLVRPKDGKHDVDDISYMVGKQVKVVEKVSPRGRVVYKSVTWEAESEDRLEEGVTVVIIGVNGSTLFVAKLEENS